MKSIFYRYFHDAGVNTSARAIIADFLLRQAILLLVNTKKRAEPKQAVRMVLMALRACLLSTQSINRPCNHVLRALEKDLFWSIAFFFSTLLLQLVSHWNNPDGRLPVRECVCLTGRRTKVFQTSPA